MTGDDLTSSYRIAVLRDELEATRARAEAAEKRVAELEAALTTAIDGWEIACEWEEEREEIVPVRAVLEAKP